ncbi:MAG: hypothetical protein Q9222_001132, partial [Ikaeria aurantiellina]
HVQAIIHGPKAAFHPRCRIDGNQVPKVDVLIFYCGEDLSVLLDTARAACSLDYPQDNFRVTVLDDSDSASEAIEALRSQFPNIFFVARRDKQEGWHKAGNINHGLKFVASLPGGPYELVTGLDVDMIPEKDWLRRLAPHFCLNSNLGILWANQRFYNVPLGDPLGQVMQLDYVQFVHSLRRDFSGVGSGTGTGWMASRVATDAIGGFSTDGLAEDFLTSADMARGGWSVAMLDEDVQWGLVPESLNGHLKQAQRWITAFLSLHQALERREVPMLKILSDIGTIAYALAMNLSYFGVPLMVLSGQPIVNIDCPDQLITILTLSFIDFVAQSIYGLLESWTADFTTYSWLEPNQFWLAPLYIGPLLRRWMPRLAAITMGKGLKLRPSIDAANKSSEGHYTSCWQRLKVVCTECSVLPHTFVLGTCIAGAVLFLHSAIHQIVASDGTPWRYIITHAGYPPALFLLSSALKNSCKPFWYALFVPPRPDREHYLAREDKSGLAYPTEKAKDQTHRHVSEWHLILILIYFCAVLVWSNVPCN